MYKHIKLLKKYKKYLNRQEFATIKGQILAGDEVSAMKGLNKLIKRKGLGNE